MTIVYISTGLVFRVPKMGREYGLVENARLTCYQDSVKSTTLLPTWTDNPTEIPPLSVSSEAALCASPHTSVN